MTLLSKTRKINIYQQNNTRKVRDYNELTKIVSEILETNVYVINENGNILAHTRHDQATNSKFHQYVSHHEMFPKQLISQLIDYYAASEQKSYLDHTFNQHDKELPLIEERYVMIVPLIGGGNRLGALILTRNNQAFVDEDYLIAEYSSTLIAMDMMRNQTDDDEQSSREKSIVQVAINSLSFSELEAVEHIFEELKGKEGLLVASKIADRVGITRSVIVNALRKLESASVIESRSLGMKGTYIRVLNEHLINSIMQSKNK